jgi:hypothetical protein
MVTITRCVPLERMLPLMCECYADLTINIFD